MHPVARVVETVIRRWARPLLGLVVMAVVAVHAQAQTTYYWQNTGTLANDWATLGNWTTSSTSSVVPGVLPGSTTTVQFNASSLVAPQTVNLNADRSVLGASFTSGSTVTLLGGTASRVLTLGSGGLTKTGAGAVTIGAASNGVTITLGTSQTWTNSAAGNLNVLNNLSLSTFTLTGTGSGAMAMTGVVSGSGSLIKAGTGLMTITGSNTFSGGVTVNSGTLAISSTSGLSTVGGTTASLGTGRVTLNSGGTLYHNINGTNSGTFANGWLLNGGTLYANDGVTVYSGTVAVTAASTIQEWWGDLQTFSGAVSGTGNLTFQKAGNSTEWPTFVLSGSNTISGTITSGSGATLRVSNANGLGSTATRTVVSSGGALDIFNVTVGAEPVTIAGTGTSATQGALISSSGTAALSGTVTLAANAAIGGNGTLFTLSGPITGGFALSKVGTGITVLSGSNSTTGVLTVNDGTLRLGSASALGSNASVVVTNTDSSSSNDNVLQLSAGITVGSGKTLTLRNASGGTFGNARTYLDNISGTNTWAGDVVAEGGSNQGIRSQAGLLIFGGTLTNSGTNPTAGIFIRGNGTGEVTGQILLGTATLFKTEPGTWTISSAGNTHGALGVAGGAMVANATNALDPTSALTLGQSTSSGTFTINAGFTQEFASIASSTGSPYTQIISGSGAISTGSADKTLTVNDSAVADDMSISAGIVGSGTLVRAGSGMLVLSGTSFTAPISLTSGTTRGEFTAATMLVGSGAGMMPGNMLTAGTMTLGTLTFGSGTQALFYTLGDDGTDLIAVTGLNGLTTTGGTATFTFTPNGALTVGTTYPLITYLGTSPGLTGFAANAPGHAVGALVDSGSSIGYSISDAGQVIWTGATDNAWNIDTTPNWQVVSSGSATTFLQGDDTVFNDTGLNTSIVLTGTVQPSAMRFSNSTVNYTISGSGVITGLGAMPFTKSGTGTVTLDGSSPHTFSGPTTVSAGVLAVNTGTSAGAGSPLTATSGVSVASGATLRLFTNNQPGAFTRNLSGSGAVVFDANASGTASSQGITVSGSNTAFSGTFTVAPSGSLATNGSMRILVSNTNNLGPTAAVVVQDRGQLFINSSGTFANRLTLSGYGYQEAAGGVAPAAGSVVTASGTVITVPAGAYSGNSGLGALRADGGATISGSITLVGTTKISPYSGTATIAGSMTATNAVTDDLVLLGSATTATVVLTGNNAGLGRIWVNGGSTGTSAFNQTVTVGTTSGTTGSLGSGDVVLYADQNTPVLQFLRADGYTLPAGQTITSAYTSNTFASKPLVQVNTLGTGLSMGTAGTNTIDLLDVSGTTGGQLQLATTASGSGATLNLGPGATVRVRGFYIGNSSTAGGIVNQTGGSLVLGGASTDEVYTLRLGHFGAEVSTYNLSGGSITFSQPSGTASPSVASAGVAGGVYVGIDGAGIFNQSGGGVNTNWVVLDSRGATTIGTTSSAYNLSSGTLALATQWGVIGRNASTTTFNWSGGTIRNSGTGLAVAINVPLTMAGNGTLDTATPGNTFVLMNSVTGSGSITTAGGGIVQLNPDSNTTRTGTSTGTGNQTISVGLAGDASVVKVGTGTTTLSAVNAYTGATTVSAGLLNVTGTTASSAFTVNAGGSLGGEGVVGDLTFSAGGSSLPIDASTAATLTSANLTSTGASVTVSIAVSPTGPGLIPVLAYSGTYTGAVATDFLLSGSADYRQAVFADTAGTITLDTGNKSLAWNGASSGVWNTNSNVNWDTPEVEKFYAGDLVSFNDAGTATTVTLSGTVTPWGMTVSSTANNYSVAASAGNAIAGPFTLLKAGPSTLTMSGTTGNAYTGGTVIREGGIRVENATSLGSGTIQLGDAGTGAGNVGLYLQTNRSVVANPIVVSAAGSGTATLGSIYSGTSGGNNNKFSGGIRLGRDVVFDSNTIDRTDYDTISGTGSILVTGSGRTVFMTNNTFVGDLTVSVLPGGWLQLGTVTTGSSFIPDTSNVTVNDTPGNSLAEFRLSVSSESINGLNGNGTIDVNGINSTLTVGASGGSGTFSGQLQNFNTNTLALTKSGSGIQALSGTNTYSGATTITANGGILRILGQSALSTTSTVTISKQGSQGGILQFQTTGTNTFTSAFASFFSGNPSTIGGTPAIENLAGDNTLTRSLTVNATGGSGVVVESQGGLLTLTGTISNTVASSTRPILLGGAGNGVVAGPIINSTGNSGINKYGAGTWSVTGTANTFTGVFAILDGVLDVASLSNTGTASSIGSGGAIQFTGQGTSGTLRYSGAENQTTNRPLQIDPTGGTLDSSGAGTLSFTGAVTTAEAAAFNLTFTSGSSVVSNLAGVAPGTIVGQSFTSPSISGSATITSIIGNSYTISTTATATGAALATFVGGNDRTLTLAGSNTGRNTISSALGDSSAGGRLGITKTGLGTWVLSGSNAYTGPTNVLAGSFVVDGSLGASAVTVASGATLLGTGTIGGLASILGTHSPGGSPGIETFTAGLAYGSSSTLVWELSANTDAGLDRGTLFDGVNLTSGSLTIDPAATLSLVFNAPLASGSASTVDWNDPFWSTNREWLAIGVTAPATWNNSLFSVIQTGSDSTGASLDSKRPGATFGVTSQAGGLAITYVVPEPTTALLGGVGAAGICLMMLRRLRDPVDG